MTRKQLDRQLERAGIPEFTEAHFLFRQALELAMTPSSDKQIPIGTSKAGGHPDLPAGWAWPSVKRRPISFVAQVNLTATARVWQSSHLPKEGVLSFFYDAAEQPWGLDGKLPKGSVVVACFDSVGLVRTPPPPALDREYVFGTKRIGFRKTTSMASVYEMDSEDLQPEQIEAFQQFYSAHLYPDGGNNQLLGFGFALQASPAWSCPRRDYELLLQLTSGRYGERGEMIWGDDGVLQFMISPVDLAARRFDRAHAVLQCF